MESKLTTRKHKFNDGGFPREFVVKEGLRGISEETGFRRYTFVVTHNSSLIRRKIARKPFRRKNEENKSS